MSKLTACGVFAAVTTPFDVAPAGVGDGGLAIEAFRANLKKLLAYDLAGLVVAGSTGESALLEEDEKERLWRAARSALPAGRLLIAGTGCQSTQATIALTRRAADAGADIALVLPPSYFHPFLNVEAITAHYRAIADAAPIPVMIYNFPRLTHVEVGAAVVAELSRHPNIIGIKDSSGNVADIGQIVHRAEPGFCVLTGSGGALLPSLAMGAGGGILALANVAPAQCAEIYRLYMAGDLPAARALQARLIPLNTRMTVRLGPAGIKAAMDLLGYYGGPVRAPLTPISDSDRAVLRATLAEAGLNDDAS